MKRVFLTGATGSVGQAVLPQLLERGFPITALVRRPIQIEHCRTVVGSLEEIRHASGEIGSCEAIVHLACSGRANRSDVLRQDVAGTAGVIDAWQNGPFVYTSSSGAYGSPAGAPRTGMAIGPRNWYELGKFANELQLRLAERQHGRTGGVRLHPGFVLAVNGRNKDRQLLGDLCAQCRIGSRFIFHSEEALATCGFSFIGGADFGKGVAEALSHDLSGAYNIAGGFCTWRDLIQTINRLAGTKGDFVIRPDTRPQPGEYRLPHSSTILDTSAFAKATGFQPRETLEEIVEAFVRMERAQQHA